MSEDGREGVLTEPVIVPCLFMTGGAFEISEGSIRLVAWVEMPNLGGETRERRIVARLAMTHLTGHDVLAALGEALARRGSH